MGLENPDIAPMYKRILMPFDGSACSRRALVEAARLARFCSGTLRVLHIVDPVKHVTGFERPEVYTDEIHPALIRAGEDLLAQAREAAAAEGVEIEACLVESRGAPVAQLIVEQASAWEADLLVLGTHGRRGVQRVLMGSDAEQVVRTAPVPVLLLR